MHEKKDELFYVLGREHVFRVGDSAPRAATTSTGAAKTNGSTSTGRASSGTVLVTCEGSGH